MIGITIRHLRYVDALARTGHFGRAAALCAISQPALSIQIKELEAMLGAKLFERSARQVRLTSLGEAFALRARDILRAIDELGDLARASAGPLAGRLGLGVIPTVAPYLLPHIIKAIAARHPGLDLRPREAVTQTLIRDLHEGRLDMAIMALPVSESALAEHALFDEDFILVRAAQDAGKPVPNRDMLQHMRLLLLEEGHCFRDQALAYCSGGGGAPRELMEGSSLSTLVQMVGAGIGVTLIPEMALSIETRSAEVSTVRLPDPGPSRRIGIVWRRSNPLAGQFAQLADYIRSVSSPSGVSASA
jgi:LysR family transcriptional regulator, hydrogen peroxide-inducible genes activator